MSTFAEQLNQRYPMSGTPGNGRPSGNQMQSTNYQQYDIQPQQYSTGFTAPPGGYDNPQQPQDWSQTIPQGTIHRQTPQQRGRGHNLNQQHNLSSEQPPLYPGQSIVHGNRRPTAGRGLSQKTKKDSIQVLDISQPFKTNNGGIAAQVSYTTPSGKLASRVVKLAKNSPKGDQFTKAFNAVVMNHLPELANDLRGQFIQHQ